MSSCFFSWWSNNHGDKIDAMDAHPHMRLWRLHPGPQAEVPNFVVRLQRKQRRQAMGKSETIIVDSH